MKLQFVSKVNEYANGNFHVVNDGKPFDVPAGMVQALLLAKHGDLNVFAVVDGEVTELPETPEGMAKANSRDALLELAKEHGLDGDGYTNKVELATAILAVKGDK